MKRGVVIDIKPNQVSICFRANKMFKQLCFGIICKMKAVVLLFNSLHAGFGRYWFNLCLSLLGCEILSRRLSGEDPIRPDKAALLCQALLPELFHPFV